MGRLQDVPTKLPIPTLIGVQSARFQDEVEAAPVKPWTAVSRANLVACIDLLTKKDKRLPQDQPKGSGNYEDDITESETWSDCNQNPGTPSLTKKT